MCSALNRAVYISVYKCCIYSCFMLYVNLNVGFVYYSIS